MLAITRDEQALFSYVQYRACPEAFAGKALGIMGAAVEGHLDSGHAVGSVSGHLYRSLPGAVRSRFVVPPEVSEIVDYNLNTSSSSDSRSANRILPISGHPTRRRSSGCSTSCTMVGSRCESRWKQAHWIGCDEIDPHVRDVVALH